MKKEQCEKCKGYLAGQAIPMKHPDEAKDIKVCRCEPNPMEELSEIFKSWEYDGMDDCGVLEKELKQFINDNFTHNSKCISKEEVEKVLNNAELLNEVIKRGGIEYLDKLQKWDKKTPYGESIN